MKILFLGCHCDDIELGCGGTVHKLGANDISCVVLSVESPIQGRTFMLKSQSINSLRSLGVSDIKHWDFLVNHFHESRQKIWEILRDLNEKLSPDIVFTQEDDLHQDHSTLYKETLRNFRKSSILTYKASARNSPDISFNYYEPLSREDLRAKVTALAEYIDLDFLYYCKPESLEAVARVTGIPVEEEFAEGFNVVRGIGLLSYLM